MAGSMVYRLKVGDVNASAMVAFRTAMVSLQARLDNRGYNFIAGFHGAPGWYCWHHQHAPRSPIQARLFLPWHRAYLWWLEQALQDIDQTVALPWWDWTVDRRMPLAYGRATIDGQQNPLRRFRMRVPATTNNPAISRNTRRRATPLPGTTLPSPAQLRGVLQESDWASFSDQLQNLHDGVHPWVGGDMGSVTTAGFDPIFYAHHCMIDRVWSIWQVTHGNGGVPTALLDLPLRPFGKTVRDVLDVQALGYEYAVSSTPIPIP